MNTKLCLLRYCALNYINLVFFQKFVIPSFWSHKIPMKMRYSNTVFYVYLIILSRNGGNISSTRNLTQFRDIFKNCKHKKTVLLHIILWDSLFVDSPIYNIHTSKLPIE